MSGRTPPDLPGEAELGHRLSLRLYEAEGGFRDLLGVLETPTAIRKKDGLLATFDPTRIFVWKVVPPQ